MYCLKDYIGIKGSGKVPVSGVYINQMPGISLKNIQKIADGEQATYAGVWSDIQDRAWRRLNTDFKSKLKSLYKIKSSKGFYNLRTADTGRTHEPAAQYRGFVVDAGIDNNGFFAFYLTSLAIDLISPASIIDILVIDEYGTIHDTHTITNAVAGVNTLQINKAYAASRLFIAVDATGLTTKDTSLTAVEYGNYQSYFFNVLGNCCEPHLSGAYAAMDRAYQVEQDINTFGLSAVISATCDYTALICRQKDEFLNAWEKLLAAELMIERMFSDRLNIFTTVKVDEAEALRDLFTAQYEEALELTVTGLQINEGDACIECEQLIKRREVLP